MFYTFRQNNSGGKFEFSERDGIATYVIIEADSTCRANRLSKAIGLYFNGTENGTDCSCCGDRWDRAYKHDEQVTPMVYDHPVSNGDLLPRNTYLKKWMGKGKPEVYIHYLDGSVGSAWSHQ